MTPLLRKLNFSVQMEIVVLNAPVSFDEKLRDLASLRVRRAIDGEVPITFAIAFVRTLAEVEAAAEQLLPNAVGDAIVWFAYPKGSSKRYTCEFDRDTGWAAVRAAGFDTVRQVAIDDDWSALRFRRAEFIGR